MAEVTESETDADAMSGTSALLPLHQRRRVHTVFAQGAGCTRLQGLVYASRVTALSEERQVLYEARPSVRMPSLAFNIVATPENPEVSILNRTVPPRVQRAARIYGAAYWNYDTPARARSAKRNARLDYAINPRRASMAGEDAVERLVADIQHTLDDTKDTDKIVLYGVSRGASSILIAIARLTEYEQSRIALVVAEAPFDTVYNAMRYRWSWAVTQVLQMALCCCTPDDPFTDETPLDAVLHFPRNVPILMFSGAQDSVCPVAAQKALLHNLQASGHTKATHVVLPNSAHANMARGPDANTYREALRIAYMRMFIDDGDGNL